jgi:hemoglobin
MRESLYDHAGGEEALHRLEELFYEKALADPLLRDSSPSGCRLTSIT